MRDNNPGEELQYVPCRWEFLLHTLCEDRGVSVASNGAFGSAIVRPFLISIKLCTFGPWPVWCVYARNKANGGGMIRNKNTETYRTVFIQREDGQIALSRECSLGILLHLGNSNKMTVGPLFDSLRFNNA